MKAFITLLVILLHVFITNAHGESEGNIYGIDHVYTNYTTKDGLPSNETYCIFQDSKGYIWIGTDRGLVKYDGYEFKTFTTVDGLTDNVILAINEDKKGNIWYTGLNNQQLGYIDIEMNFHAYEYYDELINELLQVEYPYLYFNQIHIEGDLIYLVHNEYGYIVLNTDGIHEVSVKRLSRDISDNEITGTYIKEYKNTTFIYSDICLVSASNIRNKIYKQNHVLFEYIKAHCSDSHPTLLKQDSTYYIYDAYDMFVFNGDKKEAVKLDYKCRALPISNQSYIYSTFDEVNKTQTVYFSKSPDVRHSKMKILEDVYISNVLEDENGRIWLATAKKGLFYFSNFTSKKSKKSYQVEAIVPYKEGYILQISGKRQLYYNVSLGEIGPSNFQFTKSDLHQINGQSVFFSGIDFYDSNVNNSRFNKSGKFGAKGIQVLSDSLLYIWNKRALFKVNYDGISFDYYDDRYTKDSSYDYLAIHSLYCVEEDICYLGTNDGIYQYDQNKIELLDFAKNKTIRGIDYDSSENALIYSIWGEGLQIRYDDGEILEFTTQNGLLSNFINQIYRDPYGTIWLATNKGINQCVFGENGPYIETAINASKLLTSPNVLQMYASDSILYIGTDDGLNIIDLNQFNYRKETQLPLLLDSIHVEGLEDKQTLSKLDYDQNNITFYYTALSYHQYGNIEYRYRLKGLSNNWIFTKERKAIFTGVAPGKYQFELEVQNEFGDWITLDTPFKFTIDKPYWETWWFRIIIIGILGCIIYYYISKLKQEKQLLEDKQQLSEELNESQQKALSAQLNPHFVFNSLNSIQNFILTKRTELSSDYLSMFSKLMRFVFENSKKLYVPLSDEIEALRLYLELEQVRHNHKFRYEINVENHLKATEIVLPSLLIQPIIENAIWHGLLHKLEDDRLLEVNFSGSDTHLCIEVIDNGVGRGQSQSRPKFIKKQRSSGVELTKQRLHLLSQSTGLSTYFEIIDLFDEANNPNGTCVKISIPLDLDV